MPAPPVLPAILVLLAVGAAAGFVVRSMDRTRRRTGEFWKEMLAQVEAVYRRSGAGQALRACVLRTGYVVGDERAALRLAEWLRSRAGQETQVRREDDPTLGSYWVIEATVEAETTPDLPGRWVAMMRRACRHGARGIEHFSFFLLDDPRADGGEASLR